MKLVKNKTSSQNVQLKQGHPFFSKKEQYLDFSAQKPVHQPFFHPTIQPKLTIGQPDDKYEQEANAVADQVVQRLSQFNGVQRKCTACEEAEEGVSPQLQPKAIFESNEEQPQAKLQRKCSACAQKPKITPINLQAQSTSVPSLQASSGLESQLNASKNGGSPLPNQTRSSMESAFGANFSGVRVHTNNSSVQMNQELGAQAFTHGSNIYFNQGKYDTNSSGGQHLLAHELTHVVQQGGHSVKKMAKGDDSVDDSKANKSLQMDLPIQRKMGFEFQVREEVVKHKRKRKLSRTGTKAKPIKPKSPAISSNLKMEVDTGSVIEFVTGAHDEWQPLSKEINEAVAIVDAIKQLPVKRNRRLKKDVYSGFRTQNYRKLDIAKIPDDFEAKPQSTEGLLLRDFPSFLLEHEDKDSAEKSIKGAEQIVTNPLDSDLNGLITLIVYYIRQFKSSHTKNWVDDKATVPKNIYFELMNRMNFVDMLKMLNAHDQKRFKEIVAKKGQNEIEKVAGVQPDDPLLPHGYWVKNKLNSSTSKYLFSHFLIVPLGRKRSLVKAVWLRRKKSYYGGQAGFRECKDLKPRHRKYCNRMKKVIRRYPRVTVRSWLNSMYAKTYNKKFKKKFSKRRRHYVDLLAPLPGWNLSEKGGYSIGTWAQTPGGLAAFETRNYPNQHYKKWHEFALKKYQSAATKRKRLKKP